MSKPIQNQLDRHPPRVTGDVAIVGMACTYPGARNLDQFWRNILRKFDAVDEVPPQRWDTKLFYDPDPKAEGKVYCKRGGYLGATFAFNPMKYGTMPRAVEGAEPDQFLVLRAVHEAIADAGLMGKDISHLRAEIIMGRGNYLGAGLSNLLQRGVMTQQTLNIVSAINPDISADELLKIKQELRGTLPPFHAETAPGMIPNITTGRVANRLNFMGANFTVDAACASSLIATELAVRDLLTHHCDLALAGGVHIFTNVPFLMVFSALGALSYTSTCRPFDKECDGTMPGEGVGVFVLKRLADAERDGDRIYAVIKGVGSASDGKAMSVTAPRLEGEELALRRAYQMSGVPTETVGLIEGHGTGTAVGDATELEALRRVFGPRGDGPPSVAVGSIKSMIGHTMPAAGAAAMIKTALSLYHRVLPPTLHVREPAEPIARPDSRFYVSTETRPWIHGGDGAPRRAGVNAFGFGGINAHVVLEEYTPPDTLSRPTLIRDWECELFVLEGANPPELKSAAERLRDYTRAAATVPLRDIAATLNTGLTGKPARVAIVAASHEELSERCDRAAQRLADPATKHIKDTKGIYYFAEPPGRDGKIAFLFPGEGAQYVNMLADLCVHFPEVRACFDAADRVSDGPAARPPSADIFPPPTFDESDLAAADQRLFSIERATEAVLTADGAMYTLLTELGLRPHMATGHSAGEWAGMVAAGILELNDFVGSMGRLAAMYRGIAADQTIPKMAMLAVGGDRDTVQRLAAEVGATVHIANDNCPHQVVVVTDPKDADAVTRRLLAGGLFVEKLPHDRGYHTPIFTYICDPLRAYFSTLRISGGRVPLYSCTTAQPYPKVRGELLDIVSQTFARPIIFRDTIEAMYADGARVFVEVGPRSNLTGFVDDILRGRPHLSVATNVQRRSGMLTLHHALAQLAAAHVDLKLDALYRRRGARKLTFDPAVDRPVNEDDLPGTMQVPLWYPTMSVTQRSAAPVGASASAAASAQTVSASRLAPEHKAIPAAAPDGAAAVRQTVMPTTPSRPTARPTAPASAHPAFAPTTASAGSPLPGAAGGGAAVAMRRHLQVMDEFLSAQNEVMQAYLSRRDSSAGQGPTSFDSALASAPPAEIASLTPSVSPVPAAISPPVFLAGSQPAPIVAFTPRATSRTPSVAASAPAAAVTTPPSPAAVLPSVAIAPAKPARRELAEVLLAVVSDKTGYPPEMLGLDLDMEADLGIDSIKRVEILGTLAKMGDEIGVHGSVDMEQVSKLKSLRQVMEFLAAQGSDRLESPSHNQPGPIENRSHAQSSSTREEVERAAQALPFGGRVIEFEPGRAVVVERIITEADDLYLEDHRFGPQISLHDALARALPVVPLTVSIETMAEVATLLMPGQRVLRLRDVQAAKWIDIGTPGETVTIQISARLLAGPGGTSASTAVEVAVRDMRLAPRMPAAKGSPIAQAVVEFAAGAPAAPVVAPVALVNPKKCMHDGADMYSQHRMFHGPSFQGVVKLDQCGENGLHAELAVLPMDRVLRKHTAPRFVIDPFLLDAVGQLVGYWPVEYLKEGYVLFPIKLAALELYCDNPPPGARCRTQMQVRELTPRTFRCDLDVFAPDGRCWMRVIGWEDWRFYWPDGFYDFWRFPDRGMVSKRIALSLPPGHEDAECVLLDPFGEIGSSIWENLWAHLILNRNDLAAYHGLPKGTRRSEWLFGRAAAKDAVRVWLKRHHGIEAFPADIHIATDANGRPYPDGPVVRSTGESLQVSISHKQGVAVAVAARGDVGIDLDRVEPRDASFHDAAFDAHEQGLLHGLGAERRDEWATRLWCAKEAAGKAVGVGLNNGPRTMVVRNMDAAAGRVVVGPGPAATGVASDDIPVLSTRDGDYVLAVAVSEKR